MMDYWIWNQEAEQAVLGSLFLDAGLIKECTIQPEHLYSNKLRRILQAMKNLDEKGKPIDVISVVEEVGVQNISEIGGTGYITELAMSVPTTANFRYYQDTVLEYHKKRKAIQIANKIIEDARTGDIGTTLQEGIQNLISIQDQSRDEELGEIKPSLVALYEECEKDFGEITGIPSGYKELDGLTGGFQESDLIVIGARPSVGKTAFALDLALKASKNDISMIFSLEMSKKQLLKRAACLISEIDSKKMRNPRKGFEEEDWRKFSRAMGELSTANLHIFDRAAMDINYIWSKVRKVRREYGDQKRILVVIDYLQLIVGDPKKKENRQTEISEISRALKHMARELNVAVIALSQLSRGVESRADKRPVLSDLRESGQIEQDADLIAFLYRDDYYHKETEQKNIMEIILAKQRNGPIGSVKLRFLKEFGRFAEVKKDTKL